MCLLAHEKSRLSVFLAAVCIKIDVFVIFIAVECDNDEPFKAEPVFLHCISCLRQSNIHIVALCILGHQSSPYTFSTFMTVRLIMAQFISLYLACFMCMSH